MKCNRILNNQDTHTDAQTDTDTDTHTHTHTHTHRVAFWGLCPGRLWCRYNTGVCVSWRERERESSPYMAEDIKRE